METTIVNRLPAHRLEEAQEALEKIHTRLVKAASRQGQPVPEAPTLVVVERFIEPACSECRLEKVLPVGSDCPSCDGVIIARHYVNVEVTMGRPCLAGWEFLAVVEPLDGGNLIRQVPGSGTLGVDFTQWRTGQVACDHCRYNRRRTETFLVRNAEGTIRQVGRQCLADFLGGASPVAIINSLTYLQAVKEMAEEGYGSGSGAAEPGYNTLEYLVQTSAVVRIDGWVSKGAVEASGGTKVSTASTVNYLLSPPFGGREKWRQARQKYAPISDDTTRGTAVLAWARELPGASDYEQNLALVAKQDHTSPRHTGILASAIAAYERSVGNDLRMRAESFAPSTHQGAVGTRVALELTVEKVVDFDTQYGSMHMHMMRDAAGNMYVWKTASHRIEPGKKVAGKCSIKEHGEFRGTAQTVLTRCKLEVK